MNLSFVTLGGALVLSLWLNGCGSGEVELDRSNVDDSNVSLVIPGSGEESSEARDFFEANLLSLVIQENAANWETDATIKGCVDSGCHVTGGAAQFFQVFPNDNEATWNYVGSRQLTVLIGDYANESSQTLVEINQDDEGNISLHESFDNWTTDELCVLEEWTYIESDETAPTPCSFL